MRLQLVIFSLYMVLFGLFFVWGKKQKPASSREELGREEFLQLGLRYALFAGWCIWVYSQGKPLRLLQTLAWIQLGLELSCMLALFLLSAKRKSFVPLKVAKTLAWLGLGCLWVAELPFFIVKPL